MPLDLTSLPTSRRAPFRALEATDLPSVGQGAAAFHAEHLLIEEMAYAGTSAAQAAEDRDSSYKQQLVVVFGALALGGAVLVRLYQRHADSAEIRPLALVLSIFVGLAGTVAFLMLVQFHAAFSDSLRSLRTLRDYYEAHRTVPTARLEAQVQWRRLSELETMRFARKNLLLCSTFTLASAVGLGLAALLAIVIARGDTTDVLTPPAGTLPYAAGAALALITIAAHLLYYYLRVGRHRTGRA